jgi:hemerythrin-like metal-binding protein
MAKFQDLNSFKTGHPAIDEDHANLAAIIDAIDDAINGDGEAEACRQLLDAFIEAARQHFIREEHVLKAVGFPGFGRHCLYHRKLLEQAKVVKTHCDQMLERNHLRQCFEEMARFFVDDVIRGDMEFVSYFQVTGIVQR